MSADDYIPHPPHPKQAEFLAVDTLEALYGGAAGGGKSDALLMSALEYVDVPGYSALLLRRTYADLAKPDALIPRSKQWLYPTGAKWNEQQKQWTFPSGATLSFGYLEHEDDKYHYQGSAYQFIGWDELTQFLETQYTYLFSRCRRPTELSEFPELAGVPLRIRAASNPGGVGHEWVKTRFAIDADGGHDPKRPFIPARLEDNPSLDEESYDATLSELDLVTRTQLRHGDWEIGAAGNVFDRRWWQFYDVLPDTATYGYTIVDTAGYDDKTTGDYAVLATVVRAGKSLYWRNVERGHWEFPELKERCKDARDAFGYPILIEETPWAKPLIQTLSNEISGVIPFKIAGRSKLTRAQSVSPFLEAGNFYLPRGAAWVPSFIEEHGAFPNGSHDDMVDTTSMAGLRMLLGAGAIAEPVITTTLQRTPTRRQFGGVHV
jgi:predicted phage terminase large subunit-like protein